MNKVFDYLRASKAELAKVVWPSRIQVRDHAIVVIILSLAVAFFLGAVDFVIEQYLFKAFLN